MDTKDIRQAFLDFFAERGHTIVPSSSLVPANDPTLLFTNSGMVQFKNAFLGLEKPAAPRIVDVQRCLRAGGKHNDLENVGYTARHHTFFEMLGNWSFGDYFKRDAIVWSWELLTDVFGLPADKLWVTVYETDDEAYALWKDEVGVPPDRIVRIGDNKGAKYASDNFWQMADTGPCGPCTEIFYDHGPEVEGGPPGSPDEDGDRYIEIWNLVFMQYDRDTEGTLSPLPAPCVDTGMGLERIAAVLQGVHSNYGIDLFQRLIEAAAKAVGTKGIKANSLRVIADHIRATASLIADGVLPSNEGRGYVLRRIMRRAIRHGYQLGQAKPFFYKLVKPLVAEMGEAYPELAKNELDIESAILHEEERFVLTLAEGMSIVSEITSTKEVVAKYLKSELGGSVSLVKDADKPSLIDGWVSDALERRAFKVEEKAESIDQMVPLFNKFESLSKSVFERYVLVIVKNKHTETICKNLPELRSMLTKHVPSRIRVDIRIVSNEQLAPYKEIKGDDAFRLYDTYGFPIDLTADFARERGFAVDIEGFEREMDKQRERARAASKFGADYSRKLEVEEATEFSGYDYVAQSANVTALFRGEEPVKKLKAGDEGIVVLDHTPFYGESGGQVGDTGMLEAKGVRFEVTDTQKRGAAHLHIGRLEEGTLKVGDAIEAKIDAERRAAIVGNHSATHLLHAALRKVLGDHVTQKGSLVAPDRLRFDFSHNHPVTREELAWIEDMVNAEIRRNVHADVRQMSYDEAIDFGAMALFGEKYGDMVRVMKFGDFSTELCGGTHVARTGEIGRIAVVKIENKGKQNRRIRVALA